MGPTVAGVDQAPAPSSLLTLLVCGTLGFGPRGVALLSPQTPEDLLGILPGSQPRGGWPVSRS